MESMEGTFVWEKNRRKLEDSPNDERLDLLGPKEQRRIKFSVVFNRIA